MFGRAAIRLGIGPHSSLKQDFPLITTVNMNSLNTDISRGILIQDFNLGGVKRVAKDHEVRGPKGREWGWCSWGGGSQPLPTS